MPTVKHKIEPLAIVFQDDGLVPNNPMPFLIYKGAVDFGGVQAAVSYTHLTLPTN